MSAPILVTSLAAERPPACHCRAWAEQAATPLRSAGHTWTVHVDDPTTFLGSTGGPLSPVQVWSDSDLLVALQGYLATDLGDQPGRDDARRVAEQYRRGGAAAVEALPGSYVIVLVDHQADAIYVWTDRAATRPAFLANVDGVVVLAPELKCFHALRGLRRVLVPGSLAAMTMNGALIDEHTYYRDVQLLGPARRVEIRRTGVRLARYWQREFTYPRDELPAAAEVAERLCDACRRHLARFRRPILALSGGLDSRVLLAALRRSGLRPPAVTWGFDHTAGNTSDFQIARRLAAQSGTDHRLYELDVDALPRHAERVVYLTDGLTGHLGNYTEGERVARELAAEFDAVVRGDELFGDYRVVPSRSAALSEVGLNVGKRLWLLRFLLRRDVADAVLHDYRGQCEQLLSSIPGPPVCPTDLADVLFARTLLPRAIGSQHAVFRAHLDIVSPLLDPSVVDLVRACPPEQRAHKRFVASAARAEFPAEFAISLNTTHSRVSWRQRLPRLGLAQRYLVETLLEPLAAFDAWFDRTAIQAWLAQATAEGRQVAWSARVSRWARGVANLRAFLLRPTFKERVVLNLATLKLWFRIFA